MSGFTQAQVDALTAAIALGVVEVEYPGGRKVKYASLKDMLALRDRMMNDIQNQSDAVQRPLANRSVYFKQ
jgi:hypothetical protein